MDPDRRSFVGSALAILCAGYNLLFTQTVERLYKFLGFAQPKPKRGLVPLRKDRLVEFSYKTVYHEVYHEVYTLPNEPLEFMRGYIVNLRGEFNGSLVLRTWPHPLLAKPTEKWSQGWFSELTKLVQRKSLAEAADLLALYGFEATTIEQGRYPDEETTIVG
jgi:hypothetical protein